MKSRVLIAFIVLATLLAACSKTEETEVEPIMDVSQYSRLTPEQLTDKLGYYPRSATDETYKAPSGKEYVLSTLEYEIDGYYTEFIVIDNVVARVNIYVADMDNKNNEIVISRAEDVLSLVGITPSESIKKAKHNASAIRYSHVSEQVREVWAVMDNTRVQLLKITYDQSYFE